MSTLPLPVLDGAPKCGGEGCSDETRPCTQASGCPMRESESGSASDALLDAPEHVLSTLEKDGSRRWLKPKLSQGSWWKRRRLVAYVLMVIFLAVPHSRIGGKPLIRLDIVDREFTVLGHVFLPTDTLLLALLLLMAFVGIVFLTTVTGRAWCGWACPQTVYIEFLFRPLDRLFEGTVGKGGKAKRSLSTPMQVLRFVLYLAITSLLAHTFLAYFVGTEKLATWLSGSPLNHPVAFAVMGVTTALLTYDFYYFREQTCMIACPYGRFQSVMLDRQSLIVAYDQGRGEPRRKGSKRTQGTGDCVDCNRCVQVCPVGIDIRDGLQMECINCTQCIDACDDVMERAGGKTGLVRYCSQAELDGKPWKLLRVRTLLYPSIIAILACGFLWVASTKYGFDARIIREKGAPFTIVTRQDANANVSPGQVTNTFRVRLVNRSGNSETYALTVVNPSEVSLEVIEPDLLKLPAGENSIVPLQISFPSSLTRLDGNEPVSIRITDSSENSRVIDFRLLGPR